MKERAQELKADARLVGINLGLAALQAVSAGFFLFGYKRAMTAHAGVALALQFGALIQAAAAVVLWRQRRVPGWMARRLAHEAPADGRGTRSGGRTNPYGNSPPQ